MQAVGFLHSIKYEKYSSPIFLISKRPHSVPTSDYWISSGLLTILAPDTLAILTLSVFLILLIHETFPFKRKCWAKSEIPFSVITMSGFHFRISLHIIAIYCVSWSKASHMAFSVFNYMLVWLSPFLYSIGQSKRIILGFLMYLLIFGWVMSLLTITPSKTSDSSRVPPGIFSTFAYLLISRLSLFLAPYLMTILVALIVKFEMSLPHLLANFVPIQFCRAFMTYSSLDVSIGLEMSLMTFLAKSSAL